MDAAYATMFDAHPLDVTNLQMRNVDAINLAGDSTQERNQALAEWHRLLERIARKARYFSILELE